MHWMAQHTFVPGRFLAPARLVELAGCLITIAGLAVSAVNLRWVRDRAAYLRRSGEDGVLRILVRQGTVSELVNLTAQTALLTIFAIDATIWTELSETHLLISGLRGAASVALTVGAVLDWRSRRAAVAAALDAQNHL